MNRLIGRGQTSIVYDAQYNGIRVAKKVIKPMPHIPLIYGFWHQGPHPYSSNPNALRTAYFRKRIAHKVTKNLLGENYIVNCYGFDWEEKAIFCEFVDGRKIRQSEKKAAKHFLHKCQSLLSSAGLPTFQMSPFNWVRFSNLLIDKEGHFKIVDYESGMPFPPWKFDEVDYGRLREFSSKLEGQMQPQEFAELQKEIDECEFYDKKWRESEHSLTKKLYANVRDLKRILTDEELQKSFVRDKIDACVSRICEKYGLDKNSLEDVYNIDPRIAKHLGVHVGITLLTPSVVGAPVSMILRPAWTIYHFLKAKKKGDEEEAKIHNWMVMGSSIFPGIGGASYLLPLIFNRKYRKAALALLDQMFYEKIKRDLPYIESLLRK